MVVSKNLFLQMTVMNSWAQIISKLLNTGNLTDLQPQSELFTSIVHGFCPRIHESFLSRTIISGLFLIYYYNKYCYQIFRQYDITLIISNERFSQLGRFPLVFYYIFQNSVCTFASEKCKKWLLSINAVEAALWKVCKIFRPPVCDSYFRVQNNYREQERDFENSY